MRKKDIKAMIKILEAELSRKESNKPSLKRSSLDDSVEQKSGNHCWYTPYQGGTPVYGDYRGS